MPVLKVDDAERKARESDDRDFKRYMTILHMGQAAELAKLNKAIIRRNAKIVRLKAALREARAEAFQCALAEIAAVEKEMERSFGLMSRQDSFKYGALGRAARAVERKAIERAAESPDVDTKPKK